MNASPADSRVLIVEDAPANIQALTAILREKGYAISIATNGRQALDVLASVRPDLILLDVMMPEMDGFETCSRIKDTPDWRDIPIIFLTAKSETGDIVRGFELGAVDYVAKPFHAHELLARVHTHLAMDRLRRENEQLVRAESENARHRSVAQMVAGVAHEINTPLGVINTAASLLTRWLAEPVMVSLAKTADGQMIAEDLAEAAGLITRNAHRAHKLVQDFKKVSVNQITDVRERTSLAETIEETVNLFRATARQYPMQVLFTNTLAQPRGEWTGYPGSLSQVLLNLLSNAQRYAYPEGVGGRVEIELSADPPGMPDGYHITVRDFGQGIPPENLPRIFEPFFTTGRGQGGSGLGMSIVHTIVTAHMKGAIAITSTLGEGTTVVMHLPRTVPA
jgi:signal transduction histidine kinase